MAIKLPHTLMTTNNVALKPSTSVRTPLRPPPQATPHQRTSQFNGMSGNPRVLGGGEGLGKREPALHMLRDQTEEEEPEPEDLKVSTGGGARQYSDNRSNKRPRGAFRRQDTDSHVAGDDTHRNAEHDELQPGFVFWGFEFQVPAAPRGVHWQAGDTQGSYMLTSNEASGGETFTEHPSITEPSGTYGYRQPITETSDTCGKPTRRPEQLTLADPRVERSVLTISEESQGVAHRRKCKKHPQDGEPLKTKT